MKKQKFLKMNFKWLQKNNKAYLYKFLYKNLSTILILYICTLFIIKSANYNLDIIIKIIVLLFCPLFIIVSNFISPGFFDMSFFYKANYNIIIFIFMPVFLILGGLINKKLKTKNIEKITPNKNILENEELLIFIHDLKNLFIPVLGYAEMGNLEMTREKVSEICKKLNQMNICPNNQTKDLLIENIINVKKPVIDFLKIDLNYRVEKNSEIKVGDEDLSVLIGNIIDNAIEACNKIPDPAERFINLELFSNEDCLSIMVENSKLPNDNKNPEMQKTNKLLHGFGLNSARKITKRYNGKLNIYPEGNIFSTEVIIPRS